MIVDRIMQIIDFKGINKSKFYKETGLSNGFLDKVKDIGASKIEQILKTYEEINPTWLVMGTGEMIKTDFEKGNEEIGHRLKELREKLGLNQRTFAVEINLDPSHYNKIENGKLMPTLGQVITLCTEYGLSADWLLFGNAGQSTILQRQLERAEDHIELLKENKEYMRMELERLKSRKEKIRGNHLDATLPELNQQDT